MGYSLCIGDSHACQLCTLKRVHKLALNSPVLGILNAAALQSSFIEETQSTLQIKLGISGQDGGIGRHILPPCTTIKRITTNLKTENTQNCKKIKLYGSPTTKDLKKTYSSRWVGAAEMGSRSREDVVWWQQGGSQQNGQSHNKGSWRGSPRPVRAAQGSSTRKIKPHNSWL